MKFCKKYLVPSLLGADFYHLKDAFALIHSSGIERVHLDIMDGHFVPPISMGYPIIESLRKRESLYFDAHLMVTNPERHVTQCANAGCNACTFHLETTYHPHRLIDQIRKENMHAGVALLPNTPIESIKNIADKLQLIVIMLVDPGYGGQKIIKTTEEKIEQLHAFKCSSGFSFEISVDGGITPKNIRRLVEKGATYVVSGNSFFNSETHAEFCDI